MEEFVDETVASYAILSHRWGQDEVSLQEWNRVQEIEAKMRTITTHVAFRAARHKNDYYHESLREQYHELEEEKAAVKRKVGYSKIVSCVEMARNQKISIGEEVHSCSFVWIDTCCIDKTNSAELSEAINSMFRWYRNALVCLVYLADVPTNLGQDEMESKIRKSNWFERGWTLQELLAPQSVKFFNQCWEFLFDKTEKRDLIKEITCIDVHVLLDRDMLDVTGTAKKMSWAASRTTTRKEDLAYCLLGIFDVNMPLLYGEGDKAFVRLQEEIIRQSGDLSIFAWGYNSSMVNETHGIFAPSPAFFIGCSNVFGSGRQRGSSRAVITMNNIILSVKLTYLRPKTDRLSFIYAYLHCSDDQENSIFLPLVMNPGGGHLQFGGDVESTTSVWFERRAGTQPIVISDRLGMDTKKWMDENRTISVLKKGHGLFSSFSDMIFIIGVNHPSSNVVNEVYPPHFWGKTARYLDFGSSDDKRIWYPGAIKQKEGVFPRLSPPKYEPLAYIRISHRSNKGSQMVLIVRQFGSTRFQRDIEIRVAGWPIRGCVSLVDFALRDDLNRIYEGGIDGLDLSPGRIEFRGFKVVHSGRVITISESRDATGTSRKNINNIEV
jgi:hypothetical protein